VFIALDEELHREVALRQLLEQPLAAGRPIGDTEDPGHSERERMVSTPWAGQK
jgi:hypothetical protein